MTYQRSLLDRVRDTLGHIPQTLNDVGQSLTDNEGMFQQGKFAPAKQLGNTLRSSGQQTLNNIGQGMAQINNSIPQNLPPQQRFQQALPKAFGVVANSIPGVQSTPLVSQAVSSFSNYVAQPTLKLGIEALPSLANALLPPAARNTLGMKKLGAEDVGKMAGGIGAVNVGGNIIGGGLGAAFKAGENVFTNKPITKGLNEAYQGGFEFAAKLGPIGKLAETPLKPLLTKISPATAKTINSLMDKKEFGQAFELLWRQAAEKGLKEGVGMGAYGATLPAKDLKQRARNAFDNFTQGTLFGAGTSIAGNVLNTGAHEIGQGYKALKNLPNQESGFIKLNETIGRGKANDLPNSERYVSTPGVFEMSVLDRNKNVIKRYTYNSDLMAKAQIDKIKGTLGEGEMLTPVRDITPENFKPSALGKNKDVLQTNDLAVQDVTRQQTAGDVQVKAQAPDLTAYEKAINTGDMSMADQISKSYPNDARFQVHKRFMSQGGYINPDEMAKSGKDLAGIVNNPPDIPSQLDQQRKFVTSVQDSTNVSPDVQSGVSGTYTPKPNEQLMGEAKALLQDNVKLDFKNVENVDQKVAATIQEAINLDKAGNHEAAANLYNNLAKQGTELGRGVQAFSLLERMSPESISLSISGKINKYNATSKRKLPPLSGEQTQMISDSIKKIDSLQGREKNMAINELQTQLNDIFPSTFADKAITVWKAGLLTSLRTHERNLLGNSIMQGAETAKDVPAGIFDRLMSLRTGKRTLTVTNRGAIQGAQKGMQAAKDIIKTGYDPEEDIAKFDVQSITWGKNKFEQGLKKYTDVVFRTLGAADKPFWNSSFARSLYDQAAADAINNGKQGDIQYIKGLVGNPTEEMFATATKDANYATFHDKNQLSKIAGAFKREMGKTKTTKAISEIIAPFTGVPSSIVGKTLAYSPLGLAKGAFDASKVVVKNMPELQRQAAQELGRGVMGTALFALGGYLMQKGVMTGQPKDAKESELWKLQGKQANSVLVNGKWRGINSIGPQNLILLAGAKYQQEMNDPNGSFGAFLGGVGKDQLSQTFLQGVQGPLNAINDPTRYGTSYVGGTLSSAIPNIVKDASKATDKASRETNTITDYMLQGLPAARNQLLPRRDVLGNEVAQEPTGAGAFLDLFNSKKPIDNAVVSELTRLAASGNESTPSRLGRTQTIGGKKMQLTFQELNGLEKGVGELVRPRLQQLIQSPDYKALDDEKKARMIDKLLKDTKSEFKKANAYQFLGQKEYTTSPDAPKNPVDTALLNATSFAANPVETINLWQTGEPLRKMRFSGSNPAQQALNFFGAISVSERAKGVEELDNGDKGTEVDHIKPKWLGGREDPTNYEILTIEEHARKTAFEDDLMKQFDAGTITKEQAWAQDQQFIKSLSIQPMPQDKAETLTAQHLSSQGAKTSGRTYTYQDAKGKDRKITIDIPTEPRATGIDSLDKKIKSAYTSQLTSNATKALKLYQLGKISALEAAKILDTVDMQKLTVGKSKSTKGRAKKSPKISFAKVAPIKVQKLTIRKGSTARVKLPSIKTLKIKNVSPLLTKVSDRRIKV